MLFKMATLQRIKAGEVTLAFRRWRRPTVKTGGTLRTAVGELAIDSVRKVTLRGISERDARRAGYEDRAQLLAELKTRDGDTYRIALSYAGADRRIGLRENAALSRDELDDLVQRLQRMDARAGDGPWTAAVLSVIAAHPETVSTKLAARLGVERDWLKPQIRKLKNLGLTISHEVGYSLSPRGKRVLKHLKP